ncbi:MAG: NAD(P)/FAD-dependent oxidoreductase [Deltaproteobacteria bacterium]|nr:NAD(P)/FAD-dependent oxidoreductase [Deltaproteobacteria bacterium]
MVLIIGSGFAGIGMGIRLKRAGIKNFVILERAASVGGTWRENTYPGMACDVESHLYSFSFEPNPNWTRAFAPQREILAYINHCADKYGIRAHIRFNTAATGATFDEKSGVWRVQTSTGETFEAQVVISASGHALSRPIYPDIPGRDSFTGQSMHSGKWNHDYALEGKTVAVIGTGASSIQIVPAIASKVDRLLVFQRTAPWILPKPDPKFTPRQKAAFRRFPRLQLLARNFIYWKRELLASGFVLNASILKLGSKMAMRHMQAAVRDPVLREKLTPNYTMGCKRILPSNDYYPAIARENVRLVTNGISEIHPHAVVTRDGKEHRVDAIIYATGFEAAEAKPAFPIVGRNGRDLADAWKNGIKAYKGTTVSGFPNFFLIIGPNCGLGHSSMILMMESQFSYILGAIKTLRRRKLKYLDVRSEVEAHYNDRLQARLAKSVWNTGGCNSWYLTRGGKNTTAWPGFTFEYRLRTRHFDAGSYEQF